MSNKIVLDRPSGLPISHDARLASLTLLYVPGLRDAASLMPWSIIIRAYRADERHPTPLM